MRKLWLLLEYDCNVQDYFSKKNHKDSVGLIVFEKLRSELDHSWMKVGQLQQARHGHAVIAQGFGYTEKLKLYICLLGDEKKPYLIVIGGKESNTVTTSLVSEVCSFSGQKLSCTAQQPKLTNYAYYPELFNVPSTFCQ